MVFALFLFIVISLSIESAKSLPIPHSIKHSPLGAFSSAHVTFPELAFYSVSITAILFCVVGAFVLKIVGGARILSIMERFPRSATFRNAIRGFPSPFTMAGQGAGQVVPRRPPIRRGGASPPVAGVRHGRWHRR